MFEPPSLLAIHVHTYSSKVHEIAFPDGKVYSTLLMLIKNEARLLQRFTYIYCSNCTSSGFLENDQFKDIVQPKKRGV
jgi:hypothetical protein